MYTVYMTQKNNYSILNNQDNKYVLNNKSFKDTFSHLKNKLSFEEKELVEAFESLIVNHHNTIEFGNFGSFLYTKFIDFSSC